MVRKWLLLGLFLITGCYSDDCDCPRLTLEHISSREGRIDWRLTNHAADSIWIPEKTLFCGVDAYPLPFIFVGPSEEVFCIYGFFTLDGRGYTDSFVQTTAREVKPSQSVCGSVFVKDAVAEGPTVPISHLANPWAREEFPRQSLDQENVKTVTRAFVVIQYMWYPPDTRVGNAQPIAKRIQFAQEMIDVRTAAEKHKGILISEPVEVSLTLPSPVKLYLGIMFSPGISR